MIKTTYATNTEKVYTFTFEEQVEGTHGSHYTRGVPFHVTLTMPKGLVRIHRYDYKESKFIEFYTTHITSLVELLEAVKAKAAEQALS